MKGSLLYLSDLVEILFYAACNCGCKHFPATVLTFQVCFQYRLPWQRYAVNWKIVKMGNRYTYLNARVAKPLRGLSSVLPQKCDRNFRTSYRNRRWGTLVRLIGTVEPTTPRRGVHLLSWPPRKLDAIVPDRVPDLNQIMNDESERSFRIHLAHRLNSKRVIHNSTFTIHNWAG